MSGLELQRRLKNHISREQWKEAWEELNQDGLFFRDKQSSFHATRSLSDVCDALRRSLGQQYASLRENERYIYQIVRVLVRVCKANIHQQEERLLRYSVRYDLPTITTFCIENGADAQVNDNEILISAMKSNRTSLVKFLLRKKAVDVTARSNVAIQIAIEQKKWDLVSLFLDAGADDKALVSQYKLNLAEQRRYADFFDTFCAATKEAESSGNLKILRGALLQSRIYSKENDLEFLRNASAKELCNWMKVHLYSHQTGCSNSTDLVTGVPIVSIPLIYLWSTHHPRTQQLLCFNILDFYQYIQDTLKNHMSGGVPIPVNVQIGNTPIEFFSPEQLADAYKVYRARLRLFLKLRSLLPQ